MKIELLAAIFLVIAVGALTTPTVPYIRDFDPWYHYRLAEYTFEQGTRPSFDPLSNMGENILYPPLLHYLLALPAHLPGLNVMLVSQIYPLLAAVLALIFVFLFTREVFDERTAMLAVMLLAVLPIFKGTTDFGYCDHDPLDYLFVSSTFFFFVKAIKKPAASSSSPLSDQRFMENKEKLAYYALAGISTGLFALTWAGFPLVVVILSAFMLVISLFNPYLRLLEKDVTIGFLVLSTVFAVIASLWYGFGVMPFLGMMLFSALFSYVALRLENNRNAFVILLAIVLLCSLPLLILSNSSIVDAGLAYMGLREKGIYLENVAELQTPTLTNISQHYGLQLLPFLVGLILFLTSLKKFNRATLLFLVSFALLALLASTAIRFLQYAGIFVSIFSAYLLNRLSDIASSSVKKDVFIPVMILSAVLFYPPQIVHHSVSDDWYA
ncbi:MAG: glycosyltransferase family 39 protein, partial [Candidatus Micrarchaeota archaeon]|nr:glycosyltransferase family 39 protein [Candidatus Micrarchaeota archaeon]